MIVKITIRIAAARVMLCVLFRGLIPIKEERVRGITLGSLLQTLHFVTMDDFFAFATRYRELFRDAKPEEINEAFELEVERQKLQVATGNDFVTRALGT